MTTEKNASVSHENSSNKTFPLITSLAELQSWSGVSIYSSNPSVAEYHNTEKPFPPPLSKHQGNHRMVYLLTGMEEDLVKSSLEALGIKPACKRTLIKNLKFKA